MHISIIRKPAEDKTQLPEKKNSSCVRNKAVWNNTTAFINKGKEKIQHLTLHNKGVITEQNGSIITTPGREKMSFH